MREIDRTSSDELDTQRCVVGRRLITLATARSTAIAMNYAIGVLKTAATIEHAIDTLTERHEAMLKDVAKAENAHDEASILLITMLDEAMET